MAWVSAKVYAILSNDDEGKEIIGDLPDMTQEECDRRLDEFFGDNADYQQSKEEIKKNNEDYDNDEIEFKELERKNKVSEQIVKYGLLSGAKDMRDKFADAVEGREVLDADLEDMVVHCLYNGFGGINFSTLYLRRNQSSWFSPKWSVRDSYIQIGGMETATKEYVFESFTHEVGHAMDYDKNMRAYRSSTFVSQKYNMTLQDMIKEELSDKSKIENIREDVGRNYQKLKELNDKRARGEITRSEYYYNYYKWEIEYGSINDIVEANIHNEIPEANGHGVDYWEEDKANPGTELFAEITASRVADKNKGTIKFLEKYAPKSLEIYDEIINDLRERFMKGK